LFAVDSNLFDQHEGTSLQHIAVITGASAGLGLEFARLFAQDNIPVLLIARRRDLLEQIAREIEALGVKCFVLDVDLTASDATAKIMQYLMSENLRVQYLVNNAGFGTSGTFLNSNADAELNMVRLNVSALMSLTHALLPTLLTQKQARILNIGSVAGFQPGPGMATYYATKAFVNSFSQALSWELRNTSVTVTLSCPGPTGTEFAQVAKIERSALFNMGKASATTVAADAYCAMHAGRRRIVHGMMNKIFMSLSAMFPMSLLLRVAATLNLKKV
jgi:short-subunit dehydrogenase